jgi:hypothetical protein
VLLVDPERLSRLSCSFFFCLFISRACRVCVLERMAGSSRFYLCQALACQAPSAVAALFFSFPLSV